MSLLFCGIVLNFEIHHCVCYSQIKYIWLFICELFIWPYCNTWTYLCEYYKFWIKQVFEIVFKSKLNWIFYYYNFLSKSGRGLVVYFLSRVNSTSCILSLFSQFFSRVTSPFLKISSFCIISLNIQPVNLSYDWIKVSINVNSFFFTYQFLLQRT